DPGDDRLVDHRLSEPAGVVGAAHSLEHPVDARRPLENVRPETRGRGGAGAEDRSIPQDALRCVATKDEPGLPGACLAARADRPAARHAQMRADGDSALEPQDEVLAVRVYRLERATVDLVGDALGLRARMRRLRGDTLADEHLEAARRPVERIALGHVLHGSPRRRTGTCNDPQAPDTPGVTWPRIVLAPLAGGPSTPELAAAVANAGGLGFVAAGYLSAGEFATKLARARQLTDGPLGANVFLLRHVPIHPEAP